MNRASMQAFPGQARPMAVGTHWPMATAAAMDAVLSAPGQPLDANTRARMQRRLARQLHFDLSTVPVHAVPPASGLAVAPADAATEREADQVARQAADAPLDREAAAPHRIDLQAVRVHTDPAAAQTAQGLGACAYTVGHHIVFGAGRFAPGTADGQGLLAHELVHVVQQARGAPLSLARQPMDPRHARGYGGEQGMGFVHYRQEDGWIFVEGPSGAAGHGITQPGFDGVAYNVRTDELHIVDNKSLARAGNVGSATAIDPSRNLARNLDGLIARVEASTNLPWRDRLLGRLRGLRTALASGQPLPHNVQLVVTATGGRSTGVTGRLQTAGVQYRPEPTPQAPANATTNTTPPPAQVQVHAPETTPAAAKPAAIPAQAPTGAAVAEPPAPVRVAPARPTSAWRAGMKAGGQALLLALLFAGLDYLVRRRLEKDLEVSILRARMGAMPWALRLKLQDPLKPVFMKITVESKDYSDFIPLLGWMPQEPKLHMLSIEMVRQELDPPLVDVKDERLNLLHPGVTTRVVYTEPMVP
jgi:Domain of unknown function (DUF4157)